MRLIVFISTELRLYTSFSSAHNHSLQNHTLVALIVFQPEARSHKSHDKRFIIRFLHFTSYTSQSFTSHYPLHITTHITLPTSITHIQYSHKSDETAYKPAITATATPTNPACNLPAPPLNVAAVGLETLPVVALAIALPVVFCAVKYVAPTNGPVPFSAAK